MLRVEKYSGRIMSNYRRDHQGIAQTQGEVNEDPSRAYPTPQYISPTDREYIKGPKISLCTGYVSAGSDTEIVYPKAPKPPPKPKPTKQTK